MARNGKSNPPPSPGAPGPLDPKGARGVGGEHSSDDHSDNPFAVDSYKDLKTSDFDQAIEAAKGISPSDFYMKSEDKRGHSDNLRLRIPKNWSGPLNHVAQAVPAYRGILTNLLRDAVMHRTAHWLRNLDNLDPAIMGPFLLEAENEKAIQEAAQMSALTKQTEKAVEALVGARDAEGLFALLDRQAKMAQTCREPFRTRLLRQIASYKKQYGDFYARAMARKKHQEAFPAAPYDDTDWESAEAFGDV